MPGARHGRISAMSKFSTGRHWAQMALLGLLICKSSPGAHAAPEVEDPSAASKALTTCILSTFDMSKAEELGRFVIASGKYWVKSPSGGIVDPYVLKNFDRADPVQRKRFSAVNDAESLITNALIAGSDNCGIDEDDFETAIGGMLTLESGIAPPGFTDAFTPSVRNAIAAFVAFRATLLNSREFRRGYQLAASELEKLKKSTTK